MNDYKELLGDIGDCLIAQPSETLCKRVLREAADAIEQLVKECDAAIADLRGLADNCSFCVHYTAAEVPCKSKKPCCIDGNPDRWEWRGVREVEHEAN